MVNKKVLPARKNFFYALIKKLGNQTEFHQHHINPEDTNPNAAEKITPFPVPVIEDNASAKVKGTHSPDDNSCPPHLITHYTILEHTPS